MRIPATFVTLLLAASIAGAAPDRASFERGVRAYLAAAGHPDPASIRIGPGGDVEPIVDLDGVRVLHWSVPGIAFPESLPEVADDAALDAALQAAKSARLKAAENKLIQFLRDEGAIAADASSAAAGQIDAMYATWEAALNDTQLEKKSTKYTRLIERVERAGGTELGSRYHP